MAGLQTFLSKFLIWVLQKVMYCQCQISKCMIYSTTDLEMYEVIKRKKYQRLVEFCPENSTTRRCQWKRIRTNIRHIFVTIVKCDM